MRGLRVGGVSREVWFSVGLAGALASGAVFDIATSEVSAIERIAPARDLLTVESSYCPAPLVRPSLADPAERDGEDDAGADADGRAGAGSATASVTAASSATSAIAIEPGAPEPTPVEQFATLTTKPDEEPVNAVGYGGPVAASVAAVFEASVPGAGASRCADAASERWFFAEGSSSLESHERLLIYNPFPEEAVIRVVFFTRAGETPKANLGDVAVPSGSLEVIAVNEFIGTEDRLAVEIEATRGRVVAWREMLTEPADRPSGAQLSLGAAEPAREWYFPDGGVGEGFDERIALLNPTREEAIVNISLATSDGSVQPPKMFQLRIPARSSDRIVFAQSVKAKEAQLGGVGAVVRSANGVPIVAERTVWYSNGDIEGVESEIGAPEPSVRWLIGPPTASLTNDALAILNPQPQGVTVKVSLLREDGDAIEPRNLSVVTVSAGARINVPLERWTAERPTTVAVEASAGVVVERSSYSERGRDVASLMGVPVPASAP